MKNLFIITLMILTIGCNKYVTYDAINSQYFKSQKINIEKVQFYNANRFVLWQKKIEYDKDPIKKKGKIETEKIKEEAGMEVSSDLGVLAIQDKNNPNIIHVKPFQDSKSTLKYMKISEIPQNVRNDFIRIFALDQNPLMEELYYLVPDKIYSINVHKKIFSSSGSFINMFKPKKKEVYCGVVVWEGEEYNIYFKNPTFLKISRDDKVKKTVKIDKSKGNYIKD